MIGLSTAMNSPHAMDHTPLVLYRKYRISAVIMTVIAAYEHSFMYLWSKLIRGFFILFPFLVKGCPYHKDEPCCPCDLTHPVRHPVCVEQSEAHAFLRRIE